MKTLEEITDGQYNIRCSPQGVDMSEVRESILTDYTDVLLLQ